MKPDLLLTWYGDDFSGSTDVMEALERSGIPSVLFLKTPGDDELGAFPEVRAAGIAGVSRSQTPQWMDAHLPPVFERMKQMGAPICHYKICSTFDSSPSVGSIGRALDLGAEVFGSRWVPVVVGAPILRRYTVFGNLFATVSAETFRIDRHPTMSCHPVTPMDESDLRLHLAKQTGRQVGLVDILALRGDADARLRDVIAEGADVVLFDTLDEDSLSQIGRLIWQDAVSGERPLFAVASSGLQYALTSWWRVSGAVTTAEPAFTYQAAERLLVTSGSCSPVTAGQITHAIANGFAGVPVDATALVSRTSETLEATQVAAEAELRAGRNVVVYTAMGPTGGMIASGIRDSDGARDCVGAALGQLTSRLIESTMVRRVVIAGGDTSGHAAGQLDLTAIRMVRPLAPGSPLCRVVSGGAGTRDLEIVFKGGQVGRDTFFTDVLGAGN